LIDGDHLVEDFQSRILGLNVAEDRLVIGRRLLLSFQDGQTGVQRGIVIAEGGFGNRSRTILSATVPETTPNRTLSTGPSS
jgi:hypothetical protein